MLRRALLLCCVGLLAWAGPAAAQPGRGTIIHVVQRGETLYSIAALYGVSVEAIAAVNALDDPAHIVVGQRLIIPPPGAVPAVVPAYEVQPGDSLDLLALRFGTTVADLVTANELVNPELLYTGQTLRLAGAAPADRQLSGHSVVVQPGETLALVSARHGVTQRALLAANRLQHGDYAAPGQRLLIPSAGSGPGAPRPSTLPLPFLGVRLHPLPARQGETLSIEVQISGTLTPTGTFAGQALNFAPAGDAWWALAGINALADPGVAPLALEAPTAAGAPVRLDSRVQVVAGGYGDEYLSLSDDQCAGTFDPAITGPELELITTTTSVYTPVRYWDGLLRLPVGGDVASVFGTRRSYSCAPDLPLFHEGLDLVVGVGTPVYAPAPGRVVLTGTLAVRGNAIVIDHGWGVFTGYWHLSSIGVNTGQMVQAGDYLGDSGNTGRSLGPHLHWEMRIMGTAVNVRQWTMEPMP